jgi:hypothetical protein
MRPNAQALASKKSTGGRLAAIPLSSFPSGFALLLQNVPQMRDELRAVSTDTNDLDGTAPQPLRWRYAGRKGDS